MAKLTLLIGVPGSGKSTWAREHKHINEVIVSSDEMREILFGNSKIQSDCDRVFSYMNDATKMSLMYGQDVIYDCTNLHASDRINTINMFKGFASEIVGVYFNGTLEGCLDRNHKRERKVPDARLEEMFNAFEEPTMEEGFTKIEKIRVD